MSLADWWWITWYICTCICSLSSPLIYMWVSVCAYISLFCPSVPAPQLLIFHREYLVWYILLLCINHNCYLYCCCVSIIIVICICPPGALIWLINLFLFLFLYLYFYLHLAISVIYSYWRKHTFNPNVTTWWSNVKIVIIDIIHLKIIYTHTTHINFDNFQ